MSRTSSLGSFVVNATVANMKFKSRRNSRSSLKGKSSKNSLKVPSKPAPRSFLEQNIKNAGKAELHRRKSIYKDDEESPDTESLGKESEQRSTSCEQNKTKKADTRSAGSESLKMLYLKEKNDLQTAYDVLIAEYQRRRAIRKQIKSKFDRASTSLKIILSQKRVWNDPEKPVSRTEVMREVFVAKPIDDKSESKGRFKYNRFDDVDRI